MTWRCAPTRRRRPATPIAIGLTVMLLAGSPARFCKAEDQRNSDVPAPVAHWRLDEIRSGYTPDSIGGRHGVVRGAVKPSVVDGISGRAVQFEPGKAQYIKIGDMESLCPTSAITVMAWVWIDKRTRNWADILGYQPEQRRGDQAHPLRGFRLWKTWACESIQFHIGDGEARPYGEEAKCAASGLRRMENHWMHLAATYDGIHIRIYVNAVERAAARFPGRLEPSKHPLCIGNYVQNKSVYPFHGRIDDVQLYDSALSEAAILRAAGEALQPPPGS